MLAGVGAVALLGIGGALIYALQTRDAGPGGDELYSTENRPTADGLSGLPRDYTGPVLGPALPGDLGRPILDAQNRGQPVVPPVMATPAVNPEEERRRAEEEAARLSNVFFQSGPRTGAPAGTAMPGLAGLGLGGQPATQDRHAAFLNGPVDRRRAHLAELNRRITETDQRIGRLFDAIEGGMIDKDDAMAKERMASLKALRDQAVADGERTQLALNSSGDQGVTPDMLKAFACKARERIRLDSGGYHRDHLRAFPWRPRCRPV